MSNTAIIKIESAGLRQLMRNLDALPAALKKSAETAVLRAGATPIQKAAKRNAKKFRDTGLLEKSIGLRVKAVKGEKSARVGPRAGMRQKVTRTNKKTGKTRTEIADPNKYSHLVEYGTSKAPAQPFIRPAVESTQGEVLDAMSVGLDKHLTRVAEKLKRYA